jgi:type IV pilus assembly protein PilA
MAVVVIMGILATLAAVGYRKYIDSARSSEAVHMVSAIKAAQEAYRSETLAYFDVSDDLETFYPGAPGPKKMQWGGAGPNIDRWRILNPTTDGAVMFGYATTASPPIDPIVTVGLGGGIYFQDTDWPDPPVEPWYIVQAAGDIDGDGEYSYYVATSFSNEVQWAREGE